MKGLGAYYAWDSAHEPVEAITTPGATPSAVGAYYDWNSAHEPVLPINGLGGSPESELADHALRARIDRRPPLAVVGEWARQAGDLDWRDAKKTQALTLLPLADRDLNAARVAAFGQEVPVVAIYRKSLRSLADQELRLVGTPYEFSESLAVYLPSDTARVAKPSFLTIARLRHLGDKDGGSGSLERAAKSLGGSLVYVVSLPAPRGMRAPGASFRDVFRKVALSAADAPPLPAAAAPVSASTTIWPFFVGGAVLTGGILWLVRRST